MPEIPLSSSSGRPDHSSRREGKAGRTRGIQLAGSHFINNERVILPEDRLVPEGYVIGDTQIKGAIDRVSRTGFFDYPKYDPDPERNERLKMTQADIDEWVAAGRPAERILGTPGNRPSWYVENHPGRMGASAERARARGDLDDYDGTQRFKLGTFGESIITDSNGAPFDDPYAEYKMLNGYGVVTLAYNWKLGLNQTADAFVVRVNNEGKLQFRAVGRRDLVEAGQERCFGLPGESVERGETDLLSASIRAVHEETNVPIADIEQWQILSEPAYDGEGTDERDTLYTRRRGHVEVLAPTDEQEAQIQDGKAIDEEEIAKIRWMDASEASLKQLFGMHPEYVMASIEAVRKATGWVVDRNGYVGKAA